MSNISAKVLLTGATGYLGSHITKQLLSRSNLHVVGTSRSAQKAQDLTNYLQSENFKSNKYELVPDCDFLEDPECYAKLVQKHEPQFVIHSASPFFDTIASAESVENQNITKKYIRSSRLLANAACQVNARRIVVTGAATSVIGQTPKETLYVNANKWTSDKQQSRPNERAKLFGEKAVWTEVLNWQEKNAAHPTQVNALLPYFMTGPPLMHSNIQSSSCQAIDAILEGTQFGFPQVMLPIIDVRDAARAHVLMLTDSQFDINCRYFMAQESLWFSEIIDILKQNRLKTGSKRIKTRVLNQFQLNIAALFINAQVKTILPFVNKEIKLEMDEKLEKALFAREDLRSAEESLVEMAQAIIQLKSQQEEK